MKECMLTPAAFAVVKAIGLSDIEPVAVVVVATEIPSPSTWITAEQDPSC